MRIIIIIFNSYYNEIKYILNFNLINYKINNC